MTDERVKTIYESPDGGLGQTFIYQDALFPMSVIIVQADRNGREEKNMLVSVKAILYAAEQLKGKEGK